MNKYCPAGKIECEWLLEIHKNVFRCVPKNIDGYSAFLENVEQCPWPSRQQKIETPPIDITKMPGYLMGAAAQLEKCMKIIDNFARPIKAENAQLIDFICTIEAALTASAIKEEK